MADPLFVADAKVTRELMVRLVGAFEEFANDMLKQAPDGLKYVDALMGCHNFYKAVIMDLEERSGDKIGFYRKTAVDTLALGLGIPIQRVGESEIAE